MLALLCLYSDYNIPSNNRELQLALLISSPIADYNIPSNNRELQRHDNPVQCINIITYQVITGNYSVLVLLPKPHLIITYQVITGNYSGGG